MANRMIPRPQAAMVDNTGLPTKEWYRYFSDMNGSNGTGVTTESLMQTIFARKPWLKEPPRIFGIKSIQTTGSFAEGLLYFTLDGDSDYPGPGCAYMISTDNHKGWFRIATVIQTSPDVSRNEVDGVVTLGLSDVADSGQGDHLVKLTRDAKGRVSGTSPATSDDLPEGKTHLHHTQERVQEALGTSIDASEDIVLTYDPAKKKLKAELTQEARAKLKLAETALQPKADLGSTGVFTLKDLADDQAAASAGIAIGGLYRKENVVKVRIT